MTEWREVIKIIMYWIFENLDRLLEVSSSVTVAVCAVLALNAWKKELIGKKKIEFAADFVKKAHEINALMSFVRSPISKKAEEDAIEAEFNLKKPSDIKGNFSFLIPKYRLIDIDEKIRNFLALRTEAVMYFGKDIKYIFDKIIEIKTKITHSSDALYQESKKASPKQRPKDEQIIWETDDENDPIKKELNTIIKDLEINLEPFYKKEHFEWKRTKV